MSINKRIQELIDKFENGSQRAFSIKIGVAPSSINGIVGSRHSDPSGKILNSILKSYANVNADWLITGEGSMLKGEEPAGEVKDAGQPPGCELCREKDKVIAAQAAQIATQGEYIEVLKGQSPCESGQKRKAC